MNLVKHSGILTAGAVLCSAAVATPKDNQQIREAYAKLEHAMRTRSVAGVVALEAPGYTDTEYKMKPMGATEANAKMKQEFDMVKTPLDIRISVLNIRVNGNKASVTTRYTLSFSAQSDKDEFIGTTADTLVKTAKGWQFLSTADTSQKFLKNGKPAPLPKM